MREVPAVVDVVLYPLAPVYGFEEACRAALDSYWYARREDPTGNVVVVGDSAGGYLAVACAQMALARGIAAPDQVIAYSPMLDLFGHDAEKDALGEVDPVISLSGLREVLGLWAPKDECQGVFPPDIMAGPFQGLCPVTIFAGGREALLPDSLEFVRHAAKCKAPVDLVVRGEMWHTYPLFMDMPEAEQDLAETVRLILKTARWRSRG